MKKLEEVAEVLKTDAEENLDEYGNIITKNIIKKSIIGLVFSFIASIILLCFRNSVSPIVKLNINLFTGVIITAFVIYLLIFVRIFTYYKKKTKFWLFSNEKKSLKGYYNIGYIFDTITFLTSAFIIIYLGLLFILTPTTVVGQSMEDTFYQGDKIIVWNILYSPSRNDVVVIDANAYSNQEDNFYIKRVVGLPEDELRYDNGYLYINDVKYDLEGRVDNLLTLLNTNFIKGEKGIYYIPSGKYFVLGDNRAHSSDSRYFGLINKEQVLGRVIFRLWPFDRIGFDFE